MRQHVAVVMIALSIFMAGILTGLFVDVQNKTMHMNESVTKLSKEAHALAQYAQDALVRLKRHDAELKDVTSRLRRAEHLMRIAVWERKKVDEEIRADEY